jgi:hypothetical protein
MGYFILHQQYTHHRMPCENCICSGTKLSVQHFRGVQLRSAVHRAQAFAVAATVRLKVDVGSGTS